MKNTKVYITGIGDISSLGYDKNISYEKIIRKESGLKIKSDWQNDRIGKVVYGQIPDIKLSDHIKWPDRFPANKYSAIGLLACKQAIVDANINLQEGDNEIGLIIETSLGATEGVEAYLYDLYKYGLKKVSPLKFTKTVANTVLGDISRVFKLNGCSSLLYNENSISYGYDLIKNGSVDMVICGGLDHYTDYRVLSEREKELLVDVSNEADILSALNQENERKRSIPGEGASFIVLESKESMEKRKASPYAELVNYHSNFDYLSVTDTSNRSPSLLKEAIDVFREDTSNNIAFVSAFITNKQYEENELPVVNELREKHSVQTFFHKPYTGDMKAGSSVMGVAFGAALIKSGSSDCGNNKRDKSKIKSAIINTVHEGGTSSYFLLR